jgi:hypothetical protein
MLSQQQYSDVVYTASRANAALVQTIRAREALGCVVKWNTASCQDLKIKSGFFSLRVADFSSVASVDIYNQLLDIGSTWAGGIAFDPNAQVPETTIDITTVLNAQANYDRIKFGEGGGVFTASLSNFQATYIAKYGDNAIVQLFVTVDDYATMQEDTGTVPTIVNLGGDINKPDSYTWTFGIPTTGYIQITGFVPQGANIVALPITNNSAVLLDDATLNGLYPGALWGQLILLPNVPAKYLKLDNSPTGQWDLQTYVPNT